MQAHNSVNTDSKQLLFLAKSAVKQRRERTPVWSRLLAYISFLIAQREKSKKSWPFVLHARVAPSPLSSNCSSSSGSLDRSTDGGEISRNRNHGLWYGLSLHYDGDLLLGCGGRMR
jgi:hypothetical protein